MLDSMLFVLVGLQLAVVLDALGPRQLSHYVLPALAVAITVMAVRMGFVLALATSRARLLDEIKKPLPRGERLVVGWSGMRGAVSLAAALAIPLDASGRDVVLLVKFATILVTLVVQGLALPRLVRACGLERSAEDERQEQEARLQAAEAALQRLDRAGAEDEAPDTTVERLRTTYLEHAERAAAELGDGDAETEDSSEAYAQLRGLTLEAERDAILKLRRAGRGVTRSSSCAGRASSRATPRAACSTSSIWRSRGCAHDHRRRRVPAMADEPVLTERRDGVLLITLNRPDARNAVNLAVAEGIASALDGLDRDDELTVGVLTGAGKGFSAGMDLKAFVTGERPWVGDRGFAGIVRRSARKPLIAAVEGFAMAGGLEIALACDLIVASREARLGIPEVKRSLVAAAGALRRLPQRVPLNVAMELALTGDPISAERGYEIGLVNRVTQPGGAVDAALELAAAIARNGPLALDATKDVLSRQADWDEEQFWREQGGIVEPVLTSEDAREGATAFSEKRDPVWKGR